MEKYYLYIVLTRTNTIISRAIQFFKCDQYTHAAISLDRKLDNMYSFSRKHPNNPFIGVFKQEKINDGLYKYQDTIPGLVMEVEVSRHQYENAKKLLEHFISYSETYKYNYMGLVHSLLNKSTCHKNRFLCSEFVYYILNESGIVDFNMPRNLVRPQSLLNLNCNIVFMGDLKEMRLNENACALNDMRINSLSAIY